jgi:peroxiredoxin
MTEKSGSKGKVVFIVVFVALIGLFIAGTIVSNWTPIKKVISTGDQAPEFSLRSFEGASVSLRDLRGKVVMVHFWATWCPPCVEEIPALDRLYRSIKGKEFEMLAVSVDEGGAGAVASFIQRNRLSIPVLFDPQQTVARLYGTSKFPETYIIDRNGVVSYKAIGPKDWTDPSNIQIVKNIIESK